MPSAARRCLSPGPVAGVVLEGAAFLRAGEAIDEPGQVGVGVVGQGVVEPRVAAVLIEDAARQAAGVLRDAALEAVAVAEPLDLAVGVIRGGGGMAAGLGGLAEGVGGEGQAQGGAGRGVGVGERGVVAEGGVAAGEAEGSVFRRQVQGFGGGQAALVVAVGPFAGLRAPRHGRGGGQRAGGGGVQRAIGVVGETRVLGAAGVVDGDQAVARIVDVGAALARADRAGLAAGGAGQGVLAGGAPGQVAGGVVQEQRDAGVGFDGFAQALLAVVQVAARDVGVRCAHRQPIEAAVFVMRHQQSWGRSRLRVRAAPNTGTCAPVGGARPAGQFFSAHGHGGAGSAEVP